MTDCVPDSRYTASPEFLLTTLHSFALIEIPVMCFGAYCILFKTPDTMGSVKWLMLNLHIWSVLSDFWICFFAVPYVLLPIPAGYPLGVYDNPRAAIYFHITFVAALSASVLAIYENRYFVLFGEETRWKHFRKPILFMIYLYIPFIYLPPILNAPDQATALPIVISKIPCQNPHTYENREIFVLSLDYKIPFLCLGAGTVLFAISILVFAVLTFYKLFQNLNLSHFSQNTNNLQKKFAIALTIQSLFMLSCVLAPVSSSFVIIYFWYHNQALNNFIFIILSLHGVGSTIVMVCVHRPYREFTFGWITRRPVLEVSKLTAKSPNIPYIRPVVVAVI